MLFYQSFSFVTEQENLGIFLLLKMVKLLHYWISQSAYTMLFLEWKKLLNRAVLLLQLLRVWNANGEIILLVSNFNKCIYDLNIIITLWIIWSCYLFCFGLFTFYQKTFSLIYMLGSRDRTLVFGYLYTFLFFNNINGYKTIIMCGYAHVYPRMALDMPLPGFMDLKLYGCKQW